MANSLAEIVREIDVPFRQYLRTYSPLSFCQFTMTVYLVDIRERDLGMPFAAFCNLLLLYIQLSKNPVNVKYGAGVCCFNMVDEEQGLGVFSYERVHPFVIQVFNFYHHNAIRVYNSWLVFHALVYGN